MLNFTYKDGGDGVGKGFITLINLLLKLRLSRSIFEHGEVNLDEPDTRGSYRFA